MDYFIKQELHQLIDNCDNELLLEEVKTILQNNPIKNWWDELADEDKSSLAQSETQFEKGEYIIHTELLQQFTTWAKNNAYTALH